ncbi:MAG: hypothetical protein AAGI10_13250 [Pseudomonadota bacterium]
MQQIWILLLVMGAAANFYIAWLAYNDGEMGQVATAVGLAALCGFVAYLRIRQAEKK